MGCLEYFRRFGLSSFFLIINRRVIFIGSSYEMALLTFYSLLSAAAIRWLLRRATKARTKQIEMMT